ncbi:hypothetical protein HHI36_019667 [Cryptolaemus montrouzieri]|uniref:Uncharacterized protein n=1 Tax=Cryptolaemus montrouzieri TaxID=559131 RepID=A0ABD2N8H1_9CUCU
MELVQELVRNQVVYITVLLVVFLAILVFAFGFQTAKEPPFVKITNEDRKQQNKKRKIKEKVCKIPINSLIYHQPVIYSNEFLDLLKISETSTLFQAILMFRSIQSILH